MEFSYEQESMYDTRKTIFIGAAVKLKRCRKCSKLVFVNDMANEFVDCRDCRGTKNKIETHSTNEDRVKYED